MSLLSRQEQIGPPSFRPTSLLALSFGPALPTVHPLALGSLSSRLSLVPGQEQLEPAMVLARLLSHLYHHHHQRRRLIDPPSSSGLHHTSSMEVAPGPRAMSHALLRSAFPLLCLQLHLLLPSSSSSSYALPLVLLPLLLLRSPLSPPRLPPPPLLAAFNPSPRPPSNGSSPSPGFASPSANASRNVPQAQRRRSTSSRTFRRQRRGRVNRDGGRMVGRGAAAEARARLVEKGWLWTRPGRPRRSTGGRSMSSARFGGRAEVRSGRTRANRA